MPGRGASRLPSAVVKVHKRLLPLFVALVVTSYLDRTSLAFAALQLCHEPWFTPRVYGIGAGLFTLGYVTCQVPSNLVLARVGARAWLPAITAAWGIVAACCIFISSRASFYALRLALGVAEAGAFPAMWAITTQWYPPASSTVAFSVIEASVAISQIVAAPVAAGLMQLSGVFGLAGWQHLFLATGLATIAMAVVLRVRLPSSIAGADFLTEDERLWLLQQQQQVGRQHAAEVELPLATTSAAAAPAAGRQASGRQEEEAASCSSSTGGGGGGSGDSNSRGEPSDVAVLVPPSPTRRHHHHHQQQQQRASRTSSDLTDVGAQARLLDGHANSSAAAADAACEMDPPGGSLREHTADGGTASKDAASEGLTARQQLLLTARNRLLLYLVVLKALKDISLDGLVYFIPLLVHALIDNSASLGLSPAHPAAAGTQQPHEPAPGQAQQQQHCGLADTQLMAVLVSAMPFGAAAAAALLLGHSSEVRDERRRHIAFPLLVGGALFALMPAALRLHSHVPAFICLTAGIAAADATTGPFWAWVQHSSSAAPGTQPFAFAAVNSLGKAGGVLGPLSFGLLLASTGSYLPSILFVASVLIGAGGLALAFPGDLR